MSTENNEIIQQLITKKINHYLAEVKNTPVTISLKEACRTTWGHQKHLTVSKDINEISPHLKLFINAFKLNTQETFVEREDQSISLNDALTEDADKIKQRLDKLDAFENYKKLKSQWDAFNTKDEKLAKQKESLTSITNHEDYKKAPKLIEIAKGFLDDPEYLNLLKSKYKSLKIDLENKTVKDSDNTKMLNILLKARIVTKNTFSQYETEYIKSAYEKYFKSRQDELSLIEVIINDPNKFKKEIKRLLSNKHILAIPQTDAKHAYNFKYINQMSSIIETLKTVIQNAKDVAKLRESISETENISEPQQALMDEVTSPPELNYVINKISFDFFPQFEQSFVLPWAKHVSFVDSMKFDTQRTLTCMLISSVTVLLLVFLMPHSLELLLPALITSSPTVNYLINATIYTTTFMATFIASDMFMPSKMEHLSRILFRDCVLDALKSHKTVAPLFQQEQAIEENISKGDFPYELVSSSP